MPRRKTKPKRVKQEKCFKRGCHRTDIIAYGCCSPHFQQHQRQVEMGRTTWDELIAQRKVLPKKKDRKKAATK